LWSKSSTEKHTFSSVMAAQPRNEAVIVRVQSSSSLMSLHKMCLQCSPQGAVSFFTCLLRLSATVYGLVQLPQRHFSVPS